VCTPVGANGPSKKGEFNKDGLTWDPLGPAVAE
jgi:hypothetical protein